MQAIMLALDRKEREREMVSLLLAELHPRVLSEREIGEGFTAVMLSCEVTAPVSLSYVFASNHPEDPLKSDAEATSPAA